MKSRIKKRWYLTFLSLARYITRPTDCGEGAVNVAQPPDSSFARIANHGKRVASGGRGANEFLSRVLWHRKNKIRHVYLTPRNFAVWKFTILFIAVFTICNFVLIKYASASTQVNKDISINTTWTATNSPYIIMKPITVEKNKVLTIDPGVTVSMAESHDTMFYLLGEIIAKGTAVNKIIFDGGGNATFFDARNSTAKSFLDLDYCEIRNGANLWNHGYGYFHMRNSLIENLFKVSYVFYPGNDVYIEHNEFRNAAGFSICQGEEFNVYFRYNYFNGKNANLPSYDDYWIQNWSSFNATGTIVEYNVFNKEDGIILELPSGYPSAAMIAANNYWGTTDIDEIDSMIYDQNDSLTSAGLIDYVPFLTEPPEGVPGIVKPEAPTVNDVISPTNEEKQTLTGTKEADTSIWINGEEEVSLNKSTDWSYEISLDIGENNFTINAKNALGIASEPVNIVVVRNELICIDWEYSDWSGCINGEKTRTIINSSPEGCSINNPILSQTCQSEISQTEIVNTVEEEKELVTQIDKELSARLSGRILLQVERNGEAWYIYPDNHKKYFLGRPADAFSVMRSLGLGATHEFITSHTIYSDYVLGKILLDVEEHGEAYYINPVDKKAYYLGRPADAWQIMRDLGLGITNVNIRKIGVGEI